MPNKAKYAIWAKKAQEDANCYATDCNHPVHSGDWAVYTTIIDRERFHFSWCQKTGMGLALRAATENSPNIWESFQHLLLEMPVEVFEKLNKNDKITALAKRFKQDRAQVELLGSEEKMIEIWKRGTWTLDTSPLSTEKKLPSLEGDLVKVLADALKVPNANEIRVIAEQVVTERTPGIITLARDSMAKDINDLKELLNSKRTVEVVTPEGMKKDIGHQHQKFEDIYKLVSLKLNLWLAGPAGAGKSYLCAQIAEALGRPFFRISCGPQTPASQIFGHTTAHGGYAPGIAYQALTHPDGCVLLFDEFDRMNPAVAVMVNGLLDGGAVTFPNGETLKPTDKTTYLVAANTFGKPTAEFGTAQRQDTATMSRFVKVLIPVDEKLEMNLFGPINKDWVKHVQKVRKVVEKLGVTSLVVTPRTSEYGVTLLSNGVSRNDVEEMLLWNGTSQEDIKKIKANLQNA